MHATLVLALAIGVNWRYGLKRGGRRYREPVIIWAMTFQPHCSASGDGGASMLSGIWRFASGASPCGVYVCPHRFRVFAVSLIGLVAAACNINGERLGPLAVSRSATIAIESIDGPPPAVARKLAAKLAEEAQARRFAVVSGDENSNYRVRGYLSTHVERGKTSIAWVWDIYGDDQRRALRITGEEPSGMSARDSWAGVDDLVLGRIAQSGMDRILVFLNSTEPEPPASTSDTAPLSTIPINHSPPS
jgi:hypothetical protein